MAIVSSTDFINKYELSTGMYSDSKIDDYIARYQERYLVHLLGADLYLEFISDLDADVPRSPNFKQIFEPFNEDVSGVGMGYYYSYRLNQILESDGIKEMLLGFTYWEYARDLLNQQTPYGGVKQMAENSIVVDTPHSLMWERYNLAVKTYRAIQEWINTNTTQTGQVVSWILDPGTGYIDGEYNLTGGTGSGGVVDVVATAGPVDSVTLVNAGTGYQVGDVLTIDGGNLDATLTLDYVGIGDLSKWNGTAKRMAYWI
jgi:hypothetical protein